MSCPADWFRRLGRSWEEIDSAVLDELEPILWDMLNAESLDFALVKLNSAVRLLEDIYGSGAREAARRIFSREPARSYLSRLSGCGGELRRAAEEDVRHRGLLSYMDVLLELVPEQGPCRLAQQASPPRLPPAGPGWEGAARPLPVPAAGSRRPAAGGARWARRALAVAVAAAALAIALALARAFACTGYAPAGAGSAWAAAPAALALLPLGPEAGATATPGANIQTYTACIWSCAGARQAGAWPRE